jgi:hypothetical protein
MYAAEAFSILTKKMKKNIRKWHLINQDPQFMRCGRKMEFWMNHPTRSLEQKKLRLRAQARTALLYEALKMTILLKKLGNFFFIMKSLNYTRKGPIFMYNGPDRGWM